jgi:hypothetical protein
VAVRDQLTPEERELVRELIDRRVRALVDRLPREGNHYGQRQQKPLRVHRQAQPCVYCGAPTESKTRACKYHRDLPALEGRA